MLEDELRTTFGLLFSAGGPTPTTDESCGRGILFMFLHGTPCKIQPT
nr:MAG TPA: hypothetical protein [Caudoviricetes sp.]